MSIKSMKSKFMLPVACVFALALGFSASVMAWWDQDPCTECHIQCGMNYRACLNSGQFTDAQCRESLNTCRIYQCNGCIIP